MPKNISVTGRMHQVLMVEALAVAACSSDDEAGQTPDPSNADAGLDIGPGLDTGFEDSGSSTDAGVEALRQACERASADLETRLSSLEDGVCAVAAATAYLSAAGFGGDAACQTVLQNCQNFELDLGCSGIETCSVSVSQFETCVEDSLLIAEDFYSDFSTNDSCADLADTLLNTQPPEATESCSVVNTQCPGILPLGG